MCLTAVVATQWVETDPTGPLSEYGCNKLESEQADHCRPTRATSSSEPVGSMPPVVATLPRPCCMPYTVTQTRLPEVLILEPKVFGDARGFFYESFNALDFAQCTGLDVQFVQDNHSKSAKGVLRGLHYQIQHPQGKLVRVTQGEVFDVAVDLRMGRGFAWLDTGTHDSLLDASQYIATLEKRQGLKVACPEEIAYRNGWIDANALEKLATPLAKNGYGQYLLGLLSEKVF
jgi:hypothetical protein